VTQFVMHWEGKNGYNRFVEDEQGPRWVLIDSCYVRYACPDCDHKWKEWFETYISRGEEFASCPVCNDRYGWTEVM